MPSRRSLAAVGLAGLLLLAKVAVALPVQETLVVVDKAPSATRQPLLNTDFPDPSILQDADDQWYAFATTGNNKNIQAASAPMPGGPWTYVDRDMLPDSGPWTTGNDNWAPDVQGMVDGTYVMYYSGDLANSPAHHCVGVATSSQVLGPYKPHATPWACPFGQGGAIDPSGFIDQATGRRYVVYKIDGNSIGHGGDCGNSVAPIVPTFIMLQEVGPDGVTKVGAAVRIFDRSADDGPLVEAPNLVRTDDGLYILFYSSWCYSTDRYNTKYAMAQSVAGNYTRGGAALLQTGTFGLTAPGGATSTESGHYMLFHANCPAGRCLYGATWGVQGVDVILS